MITAGSLAFLLPFALAFLVVIPGLYDTTMTSRLALFPLLGALTFLAGRSGIGIRHLVAGAALSLAACLGFFIAPEPMTVVPYAVRWMSFGLMLAGFCGTISKWGLPRHLDGLTAAAAGVSLLMVVLGPDAVSGNPNRTGMLLSLGVVASLADGKRTRALLKCALILPGLIVSQFYISWLAALLGAAVLPAWKRFKVNPGWLIILILALQALFTSMPRLAHRTGPTVELRALVWRTSAVRGLAALPLGTGAGQARLTVYSDGGDELQNLAGADRRVDFLHSEPLTMFTEFGVAGLAMLVLFLTWVFRTRWEPLTAALISTFWLVFTTDLPLATPLGALPAALVVGGCLKPGRTVRIPVLVPALFTLASIPWAYTVSRGYAAMNHPGNPGKASEACRYIPFEERAFLNAGWAWLHAGSALEARNYSRRFIELYPQYHGGWELEAGVMAGLDRPAEAAAAFRRAFVLAPKGLRDRPLYALNGIPYSENSGDTLVLLGNTLAEAVPWHTEFPGIPDEGFADTALRHLALAMNLRSGDPGLAGALYARALILMGYDSGLSWSGFREEALRLYPIFSELVPDSQRVKVESLIATL